MKRTTASLLTGALASVAFVGLAALAPSIASANCAEPILIDSQGEYDAAFSKSAANDTRAGGRAVLEDGGLHVFTVPGATPPAGDTRDQRKVTGYYDVTDEVLLRDQTAQSNYDIAYTGTATPATATPGYQLVIDFDGDSTPDGILIGEDVYGENWWLNNEARQFVKDRAPKESGGGSPNNGDLDQWVAAFPNAEILSFGYSLGSGVDADYTITKLTFGCNAFVFDGPVANQGPVADLSASQPDAEGNVTFTTNSTDDKAVVNQTLDFGDGTPPASSATETTVTHKYAPGDYVATLTAYDAEGLSSTDTVQITIARPANTVNNGNALPDTGANVLGLAVIGGVAVAGASAGLVVRNRRRSGSAV